jgi:hypothetical protein
MTMTLKLGKKDFIHDNRDLRWDEIKPKGVATPKFPKPHGGFGMDFKNWLMLGNGPCDDGSIDSSMAAYQGGGDCVIADKFHAFMESAHNAGRPIPSFTALLALQTYSTLGQLTQGAGYDLQTGANDNGLQIRDALDYSQKNGFVDTAGTVYKLGPYVKLQPGNLAEFWEALWYAEHISIGVQLQQAQMDQFNAGQQLTYVPGSPTIGGHDELIVGHPVDNLWTGAMWASRYTMTPSMITKTCDEAWVWFDPEQISAKTGKSYEGYDPALLEEYLAAVAAEFPTA